MSLLRTSLAAASLFACAFAGDLALAQDHRAPPQAALNACNGKADGVACSFEGRRGQVQGTCQTHPELGPICRAPHRGPPPQAIDACAGRSEGAPCSFDRGNGETTQGTCHVKEGRPAACRPARDQGEQSRTDV